MYFWQLFILTGKVIPVEPMFTRSSLKPSTETPFYFISQYVYYT